jgi:hypothetical protein
VGIGIGIAGGEVQSTPGGDVTVVVLEGDDIGAAMGTLATSQEPFDT